MDADDFEPFESPRIILEGVKKIKDEFETGRLDITDPAHHEFIRKVDHSTKELVICLQLNRKIPPDLHRKTYHMISDMKHALDQALCDAAVLTKTGDPTRIYFPIGKSEEDLQREIDRRCKRLNPELIEFVKRAKICETGNPRLYATLSLAGPNKHQRIVGVRPRNDIAVSNYDPLAMKGPITFNATKWIPSKNHVELIRIGDGGYFNLGIHVVLGLCLGKGLPPLDGQASQILTEAVTQVEKIIGDLEALTYSLVKLDTQSAEGEAN